jgi:hypothetical protein
MVTAASEVRRSLPRGEVRDMTSGCDVCKARANCLKPKEIGATMRRFDLQGAANCLKVKTIARTGAWRGLSGKNDGKHDP